MDRPTFDEVFMENAVSWAKRSTCLRRQVGAVAVLDNNIIATGYNGVVSGAEHCDSCLRTELDIPSGQRHEICRAIHAEQNLVLQCAKHGKSMSGATVYITHKPCIICFKLLCQLEINKIYYLNDYPDQLLSEEIIRNNYRDYNITGLSTNESFNHIERMSKNKG